MAQVYRKVTYRLYPSAVQARILAEMLGAHQRLYNAALQQRIWAWHSQQRHHVTFAEQCRQLTELRAAEPEYAALNAQSCQVTLKRLDLAFQHFFRRVKQGDKPGFPRYKSYDRYPGWGYTNQSGWGRPNGPNGRHGYLRLEKLGHIPMRGCPRTLGEAKTLEIMHKNGKWYASVTLACEPQRDAGTEAAGLDWGVETFATLALPEGKTDAIANPRLTRREANKLRQAQRALTNKQRGSKRRNKARKKVATIHHKTANRRQDFLHQETAKLVKRFGLIATEQLNVKGMTAHGGRRKRGLNREVLSTAPATFLTLLRQKAEEAAVVWVDVPTRQVKPSQTCSGCGRQARKCLSERNHRCPCGLVCGRDENAARVMLNWALYRRPTGREPARRGEESAGSRHTPRVELASAKRETPSVPA